MPKSFAFQEPGTQFQVAGVSWYQTVRALSKEQVLVRDLMTRQEAALLLSDLMKQHQEGHVIFALSGPNLHEEEGKPLKTAYDFTELRKLPLPLQQETKDRIYLITPLLDLHPAERTDQVIEARIREYVFQEIPRLISSERTVPLFPLHQGRQGRPRRPDAPVKSPETVNISLPQEKGIPAKTATIPVVSTRTVSRWIATFELGRRDPRSLVPGYYRRGPQDMRLSAKQRDFIEQAVNEVFKQNERAPVTHVIDKVKALVLAANQTIPEGEPRIEEPKKNSIYRYLDRLDDEEFDIARLGRNAAARKNNQAGQGLRPTHPNEIWEMDSCIPDLLVIDDTDGLPIGRPRLTVVRDKYTGYPVGLSVSFDPPSAYPVLECLYYAIIQKDHVKELFGLRHEYLAFGVPEVLAVDRGKEFINEDVELACEQLGIELVDLEGHAPWLKGAIERWFRTVNTDLIHTIPGTTFSNFLERGDYDSSKHACITLDGLWYLLHKWIVDIYTQKGRRGFGVPARLWERACEKDFVPRLPQSRYELTVLLSRTASRGIENSGVQFENLFYPDTRLAPIRRELKKQLKRKHPESGALLNQPEAGKVWIKYNAGDLSRIWVLNPFSSPPTYLEVLAADQEYTSGLSLWKHLGIKRYLREQMERDIDAEGLILAKEELRQFIYEEFRYAKKTGTRKYAARWLDIHVSDSLRGPRAPSLGDVPMASLAPEAVELAFQLRESGQDQPAEAATAPEETPAFETSSVASLHVPLPPPEAGITLLEGPKNPTAGTRLPMPSPSTPGQSSPAETKGVEEKAPPSSISTDPDPQTTFGIQAGFIRPRAPALQEVAHGK